MSERLAIEFICGMGMPPDAFVRMAASLGVSRVGLSPHRITDNRHGFPDWDLRRDPALVRATKDALAETGVTVSQGEGFLIMPGTDVADAGPTMDLMADLGAPLVNTVLVEQDRARAIDQFARLAEMAAERGLLASIEFMPLMWPASAGEALAVIEEAGAANGRLMLDAMHWYRSGATTADLRAIPADRIGYIQICDVPLLAGGAMSPEMMQAYGEEARHERLCPGDGDLPLADFIAALPQDVTVGLEIPMLSKAKAGISPADAMRPCVEAARGLLVV
jgi:sugar phosphate isomerase/epimerase